MLDSGQVDFLRSLWDRSVSIGHLEVQLDDDASLEDYMEPAPYEGQDKIVHYLRHAGFYWVRGMNGGGIKCDGDFHWVDSLPDLVERTNLRLEPEFERAVLKDPKRMTRLRKDLLDHGIHTWDL